MITDFKLFEVAGVSIDVMEWTEFIYGVIIRHGIPMFMKKAFSGELKNEITIDGEIYEVDQGIVSLSGKKFDNLIKHHISPDSELMIRNFTLDLEITLMEDSIWSLDDFNAEYTEYDAKKRYEYLEKASIKIDIFLPDSILEVRPTLKDVDKFLKDQSIRSKIYEVVSHEVDHAFEYFQRREKGQEIFPEELLNSLINMNKRSPFAAISNDWKEFLNLCYLHLSFEQNARVTQLYYGLRDTKISNVNDFITKSRAHDVWKSLEKLRDFDAQKFYNNFTINADEQDLKDTFLELGIYTEKEMEGQDIKKIVLKYLIKTWDDSIDKINQGSDIKLDKLSSSVKENPVAFFKFFEKRFHKNWEKFYKKVSRLAPEIIGQEED